MRIHCKIMWLGGRLRDVEKKAVETGMHSSWYSGWPSGNGDLPIIRGL